MTKISEKDLTRNLRVFLESEHLIDTATSHFNGDDEEKSDIELVLISTLWRGVNSKKLYIEAKSHHSKDSQNTINKIFGQLLKETGKRTLDKNRECLAILFPSESAKWIDNKGKTETRIDGIEYYRRGFSRINSQVFISFGELVGAKYILSFNSSLNELYVFEWRTFLESNSTPILTITNSSSQKK
ncbi:hypothetical protein [Aeromonas veronii]|uniref:hypothetical protein n=1 Tax=Aeromonas TaxID=642 RepID=UPI00366A5B98